MNALLVVTRANFLNSPTLAELRRVLASCPAAALGFVLTDADRDQGSSGRYGPSAYLKSAPRRTPAKVRDGDSDAA